MKRMRFYVLSSIPTKVEADLNRLDAHAREKNGIDTTGSVGCEVVSCTASYNGAMNIVTVLAYAPEGWAG